LFKNKNRILNMIPVAEPLLGEEELKNVIEAMKSGWISSKGKFIEEFEMKFAKYIGTNYGVATMNGTVALHLALKTLGIEAGDEVIVPDLSFIATANTVAYCNAKPIFVDSNPEYWCLDPYKIEESITTKTKAIIPVHLYGHPCDMDIIMELAEKYNLYIIEDAAEAHGSKYKGKTVGSFGHINCYSFFANKVITTGEGGMCLTDSEELYESMKMLRDHGMNSKKRYWHDVIGFNYRMTNLQGAVGVAQLTKIERFIEKKRLIANWYKEELKEIEEKGYISLHPELSWARNIFWMYSILINEKSEVKRDVLIQKLRENQIDSRPFFYPAHMMPPYKNSKNDFKNAEYISTRGVNLPSSPLLEKEDIEFIVKTIKNLIEN
jgi:perosamine synthetase